MDGQYSIPEPIGLKLWQVNRPFHGNVKSTTKVQPIREKRNISIYYHYLKKGFYGKKKQ